MCGSATHSPAPAATAASAAVPPAFSVAMAAALASGCEVAAIPSQAKTGERPGLWKSRNMALAGRSAGGMNVFNVTDRNVAPGRPTADRKSARHFDKGDDEQKE